MKPIHLIPLSFMAVIIIGAVLLMMPFSSANGEWTDLVTALFTSTTSVCVTGLVVVDTFSYWSFFGQLIIVALIQIGGLGVVTVGAIVMHVAKKKFTLGHRVLLEDSLNLDRRREVGSFIVRVVAGVFAVEEIGALIYAIEFIPRLGFFKGIWAAIFQSVSAFCNAGMDVVGPNSMIDFNDSPILMIVTMVLIVVGGIGFVVWYDIIDGIREGIKKRFSVKTIVRRFSEHSKLVVLLTLSLILIGAAIFFFVEYDNPNTLGEMDFGDKILNSFFQSVTLRTAGFVSVPQDGLTDVSCVVGCILMFIGGSPVGTAGGVKTVTAFLFFLNAYSYVVGKPENVVLKKRVSEEGMRKASAIVFVNMSIALVMTLLVLLSGEISLTDALYEVFSAIGTVGVSRGLTPNLNVFARLVIILTMFLGRVGPISMAIFFSKGNDTSNRIRHGEGNFYVG
ncbi:MAG: potassium transporter TrkH [Lachnospiraceae bacterium]|nr:potassium transporter TrkH [Lachnospiraceae bacterium]